MYDARSRVLILGTIPSPKSRAEGFYYMHPQNRFWKMLCAVLGEEIPPDIEGRKGLCLKHGIALWDVLESCDIVGAEDSSIRGGVPNNLRVITERCNICAVFTVGKKAHALYKRFFPDLPEDIPLPSTSPANRTVSEEEILMCFKKIGEFL